MYVPWQIHREIARLRLEETARATRYAYRAGQRRPLRRIARTVRRITGWLGRTMPRRDAGARRPRPSTDLALSGPFEPTADESQA
jgi:hypothetical protein